MERYICIHGHFYQPPRENPWLEAIELQDSAYPYHDWNERITAECYAPNATSRILDEQGQIVQMVNNYARMSFNFGPTLLAWMERKSPDVYGAVLEADRESQKNFSGHGSALAQAYNHMILPLANRRDKWTQILWGIRDFEHRFRRKPEGLWLPETAVDLETLDILVDFGIRFTILGSHQAKRVRPVGKGEWRDVSEGKIPDTMPYLVHLPSGRTLVLFFYNGPISRAVAFEKLLSSGEAFARRLLGGFSDKDDRPQLVHIATDGESYGHHHRFGDMALAYALHIIESKALAKLTNYGAYLEQYPPTQEVEIVENTSWSCVHGVERWRSDCGCHTGQHPEWRQTWRKPLREALDWLRDTVMPPFEEKAQALFKDPWAARDDYIEIILNRSPENMESFLRDHCPRELNEEEKISALKLMELQRHAMLMYTSCGWFFDDVSGIESVQILEYAARVLQLTGDISGQDLEAAFLERLAIVQSNVPEHGDGRAIYETAVKPTMADLKKVGAHYAVCSLFREYERDSSFYCYTADQEETRIVEAGKAKLLTGKARFHSEITKDSAILDFGALHLGDHTLICGVNAFQGEEPHEKMVQDVSKSFSRADFPETIRRLDRHFSGSIYSLKSLFRDEESRILRMILESILEDAEGVYRQIYETHAPLMRFFKDSGLPAPRALNLAAEFVLNATLHRALDDEAFDPDLIETLLEEARGEGVGLDAPTLEFTLRKTLERLATKFSANPWDVSGLQKLKAGLDLLPLLPFQVNLWKIQNLCYEVLQSAYPEWLKNAEHGDDAAREWANQFKEMCARLFIRVV